MEQLKSRGIRTSIHYPPVHQFGAYRGGNLRAPGGLEHTESVARRELTLQLYPMLTESEITVVVEALKDSLENLRI